MGLLTGWALACTGALVGTKPASARTTQQPDLKLACKKNGLYSELTLRIPVKIKSSLLKLKKKIILEVVNYSRKRK